jgi:hypothetical protein
MNDPDPGGARQARDDEYAAAAHVRERRAREREDRALEQERTDMRLASEASDPVSAAAYRRAAQTHAEAAKLHHAAVEVQANHAREHEG